MRRRDFMLGAAASLAAFPAFAYAPKPDLSPPLGDRNTFIAWMQANRRDDPIYLGPRFDRYRVLLSFNDLWTPAEKRAFLLTPREEFVLPQDRDQAYVGHYLDIGFGVTITPPGTMGRMTSAIAVHPGDKVLEIGDGVWGTIDRLGDYQLRFADVKTGQVGYFGTVIEPIEESAFTLRLGVTEAGQIAECEMLIVRQSDSGIKFENCRYWEKPILHREPEEPVSREEMVRLSNGYFDTLQRND